MLNNRIFKEALLYSDEEEDKLADEFFNGKLKGIDKGPYYNKSWEEIFK